MPKSQGNTARRGFNAQMTRGVAVTASPAAEAPRGIKTPSNRSASAIAPVEPGIDVPANNAAAITQATLAPEETPMAATKPVSGIFIAPDHL